MLIIILKSNKLSYNTPKTFYLIVSLNTLEKHIEKILSSRFQAHSITSGFIHFNQIDGIKQHSTTDVSIFSNSFYSYRLDKIPLYKYAHFWHCLVLLFSRLLTSFEDPRQSWFWLKNFLLFFLIFYLTDKLNMYKTLLFWNQYRFKSRFCSFSYSFCSLYYSYLSHIQKKN